MRRILIADDSSTIRRIVEHALSGRDARVLMAADGQEAIAVARAEHPDLILCDILMPGMTGYEVVEALRADSGTRATPVLLLTGAFEPFDEERARACGAQGHIAKPFEIRQLLERIDRELERAPQRPSAPSVPERTTPPGGGFDDEAFASPAEEPLAEAGPRVDPLDIGAPPLRTPAPIEEEEPLGSLAGGADAEASSEALAPDLDSSYEALGSEEQAREHEPEPATERGAPPAGGWSADEPLTDAPLPGDRGFRVGEMRGAATTGPVRVEPDHFDEREMREMVSREVRRQLEVVAPEIVREIAWEIVPDLVERIVREALERARAGSDIGDKPR